MALRDQPYLPLYVQDFLTDEKLNQCSASAQGVYIKIMCLLHKSETYGGILLKQKFKQNPKQITNFAYLLARLLPFHLHEIEQALEELIEAEVLHLDGDFMYQKRMKKDGEISDIRANAGSKGGKIASKKDQPFANNFAIAKPKAKSKQNPENEIENEDENENELRDRGSGGKGTALMVKIKEDTLLMDENLLMQVERHNNLPMGAAQQLAQMFYERLNATGELESKSVVDYRKHFQNWVSKQVDRIKDQRKGTKAEIAQNHWNELQTEMRNNPEKFYQEALKNLTL